MISSARATLEVARKEIMEHFRTKRIFIIGSFFAITFFLIGYAAARLILSESGDFIGQASRVPFAVAFYFGLIPFLSFFGGYTFTSVLAIVLSGDAIVGEWKDRTLFLLFSKPISRASILWGKILGAYASVLLVLVVVFPLGVAMLIVLLGAPNGESWGNLIEFFLLLTLGLLPFVSLGIFCSTWLRTPVTSFVTALGLWLVGFPVLGRLGEITLFVQNKTDEISSSDLVKFWHYFDPMNLLQASGNVLLRGGEAEDLVRFFQGAPDDIPMVITAMLAFTVFFLGLSFWIVLRRDYA